MRLPRALAAAFVALTSLVSTAYADEPADDGAGADPWDHPPIKNRLNFRVGFASSDLNGKPTLCLDITVAFGFGVETCGTGAQVLHDDPGQEMSHYRINYTVLEKNLWKGTLHARGGLGFSEMQVGYDDPGFVFGGTNRDRGSTAGPEAALSARWLLPMYKGFDFVVTGTAGLAYFAHASDLSVTKSDVQGFASIEAGIGW
ncbi:MAG: hypothetical protein JNL83_18170 [Myxococcales bacterium]|nr:hypothetical protein [Myxococcales bacterium]